MPDPLIEACGLGKAYRLYQRPFDHLKEALSPTRKRFSQEFWPVRDVSLQVRPGEAWGLVGENGAGKSTLLKLLCGVTLPSAGQVRRHGRIGALLELGVGFHPEYSGRENLSLSAALMGLSQSELTDRLPAILEFAGIGDFIDRPLKTYSSGMSVRLAFALATCVEPEVLVTDEVLAVGDEAFQKKCLGWIEGFLAGGGTLIFCAHNNYQIKKLCDHAVWLHHGQVRAVGRVAPVVQDYADYIETREQGQQSANLAANTAANTAAHADAGRRKPGDGDPAAERTGPADRSVSVRTHLARPRDAQRRPRRDQTASDSPRHCAPRSDAGVWRFVRYGRSRAAPHRSPHLPH